MASEHATVNKDGVKTFIPLENNPEVMSHLASLLGVSPSLTFHDIYSLDDNDLLAQIPRPVNALLFVCPGTVYTRSREAENSSMPAYTGCGEEEAVIWFRQTIGHACGLIALLHSICNGPNRKYIMPGSLLDGLLCQAITLQPDDRAALLYNSPSLALAHAEAARKGDTEAPANLNQDFHHFIAFVKGSDSHLWELNGGMKGPVDRGTLAENEDVLSEGALSMGMRTILDKANGEYGFSIVAIAEEMV
ncbi:hypothetical protein DTO021C3_1892 [Paecilomyces variotii]|nr:hypothetical protein DTO021C3_1892 [Paecilomyces variotii]